MVILNFFNNSEINKFLQKILKISFIFLFLFTLSCSKKPFSSDVDKDRRPMSAKEKRRQNIDEGRGASLGGIMGAVRGGGNFEFSSSNPMWRASLETLDFLPLTTVDYSGGVIISDWYSDNSKNNDESIKITIRFLSNEIRSNSLKIIVHKKTCSRNLNCTVNLLSDTIIKDELRSTILREAALLEKSDKKKK